MLTNDVVSFEQLGPVVQNIISLRKSLGKDLLSLTVLTKVVAVIFFYYEKFLEAVLQKLFFGGKNAQVVAYNMF